MFYLAIVEDDLELKSALKKYFSNSSQIECVLAVDSIEKFLKYSKSCTIHLLLLDMSLQHTQSFYSIPKLLEHNPDMEVIMFTVYDDTNLIFQSLTYGATGYLLKDLSFEQLESQLLTQLNGQGALLSPSIARKIIQHFSPPSPSKFITESEQLTSKEVIVVNMLRDGYSYDDIGTRLGISINGARYYVKSIYRKLQINSRGELIRNNNYKYEI